MVKHGLHFSFSVSSSKRASNEEGKTNEKNKNKWKAIKKKDKKRESQTEVEKVCFQMRVKEFAWGVCKDMGNTENNYRNDLILKQTMKAGIWILL